MCGIFLVVLRCGGRWVVGGVVSWPPELQELNYLLVMVSGKLASPLGDVKSRGEWNRALYSWAVQWLGLGCLLVSVFLIGTVRNCLVHKLPMLLRNIHNFTPIILISLLMMHSDCVLPFCSVNISRFGRSWDSWSRVRSLVKSNQ